MASTTTLKYGPKISLSHVTMKGGGRGGPDPFIVKDYEKGPFFCCSPPLLLHLSLYLYLYLTAHIYENFNLYLQRSCKDLWLPHRVEGGGDDVQHKHDIYHYDDHHHDHDFDHGRDHHHDERKSGDSDHDPHLWHFPNRPFCKQGTRPPPPPPPCLLLFCIIIIIILFFLMIIKG